MTYKKFYDINLDFETLGLLTGLFIVISGLTNVGIIDDFAGLIVKFGGNNIFILYTIIVWGSVLISAFVDNITPIGASANIAAVGMLRKEGYQVSFGEFMRIGIPYTFAAVLTGYLYFWFIWA